MSRLMWVFLLCVATAGMAAADIPRVASTVALVQNLGHSVPVGAPFVDENGRSVTLGQYFHGEPVVLVLAWYRCPGLCSEVQTGVVQCLLDLPASAGRDFQVVTISIDPSDTTELARTWKETAVSRYGRAGAAAGLHYLTGTRPAIDMVCRAVGFHYAYDTASKQYAHPSGIMVLTPEGRVSRYLYGIRYSSNTLRLALADAGGGHIGSLAEKLYLLCFQYDPANGRYGVAIMRLLRLTGCLMLGGMGLFAWRHRHV